MSLEDSEANFKFNKKVDNYEIGRSYARSQAIIGALISNKMDASVLKENQTYFGNFKPSKGAEKTKKPRDQYWIHSLPAYIIESSVKQDCARVILQLMRYAWILVNPDTLWHNMVPNFVSYGTVVRENCSKEVVVEPAKGKRPAVTTSKVPQKLRSNALLLKSELDLINRIAEPLFAPTPWEGLSQEEWVKAIWANSLLSIKKDLSIQYGLRATFLSRVASVTTKRLRLLRSLIPEKKTIRKADVQASDLVTLLGSRVDPVQDLAQEILSLDPTGDMFLKEHFLGDYQNWTKVGGGTTLLDSVKEKLCLDVDESHIYADMLADQEDKKASLEAILASYKEKSDARNAYFTSLQEKYGANQISKWKANVLDYDFAAAMESQKKVRNKGKKASHITVPHEPKKTQGERKKADRLLMKDVNPTIAQSCAEQQAASESPLNVMHDIVMESNEGKSGNLVAGYFRFIEDYLRKGKALPEQFERFSGYLTKSEDDRKLLWKDWRRWSIDAGFPESRE